MSTISGIPRQGELGQRLVLSGITWNQYQAIGDVLQNRPNLRITFDRGRLELMTTSFGHERLKYLLGRLIDILAEELNLNIGGGGSTTFKQSATEQGLEPDQCYYSANLAGVLGKDEIDLEVDPPPDLALEIDVSRSSEGRMPIYAALGVPEVWRWHDETLSVYELLPGGAYQLRESSSAFAPDFPVAELVNFIDLGFSQGDSVMVRSFRQWLRNWISLRGLTN